MYKDGKQISGFPGICALTLPSTASAHWGICWFLHYCGHHHLPALFLPLYPRVQSRAFSPSPPTPPPGPSGKPASARTVYSLPSVIGTHLPPTPHEALPPLHLGAVMPPWSSWFPLSCGRHLFLGSETGFPYIMWSFVGFLLIIFKNYRNI